MATYDELLTASANTALINKVRVATFISATIIMTEADTVDNHVNRMKWAKEVFANPTEAGSRMMWAVLGQYRATPLASITNATDAQVQTAVDGAVDVFANGV